MKKQPEPTPIKTLRDAYKVSGFRVVAKLDSYELEPPALALTLIRRAKKLCAAAASKFAAASMTSAGAGREISAAVIAKSISILNCAASHVQPAA
jgi:hypothetical protein